MKKLKCPLCGFEIRLQSDVVYDDSYTGGYVEVYYYECIKCPLTTTPVYSAEDAEEDVEDLISKFPPIMRLNQGDNVLIWLRDDIYTVLGTDLEAGKIHLQDVYGDADSYYPTNIEKWPWEFEQKGGDE